MFLSYNMNKLLILNSCARSELNSLRKQCNHNEITITDVFGCRDTVKVKHNVIFKQYL